MPSIAQTPVSPLNNRKRRRDDQKESEMHMKLSSPLLPRHTSIPETSPTFPRTIQHNTSQTFPKPRRFHDSKRLRVEKPYPATLDTYLAYDSIAAGNHLPSYVKPDVLFPEKKHIDLSPCHICHRKPTVKSELDAFANCEGCGTRTCYICIRQCLGSAVTVETEMEIGGCFSWGNQGKDSHDLDLVEGVVAVGRIWDKDKVKGHKSMICSRCCAERGTEGEVWCLGCLGAEEGG